MADRSAIQLAQLEAFVAVAMHGTISAAAEALYVSQPALTARIQGLERSMGTALFTRGRQGSRLTDAGRALRPHAERANELAPDNPAIMDTLGVILLEMGETDKATGLLRRAHEAIPDNPDIGFHLAQAYVKGEHKDEARKLLAALLEKHPTFSDRDGAAALLAEIGG